MNGILDLRFWRSLYTLLFSVVVIILSKLSIEQDLSRKLHILEQEDLTTWLKHKSGEKLAYTFWALIGYFTYRKTCCFYFVMQAVHFMQHSFWLKFRMVSRNLVYFRFLWERVSRFFNFHVTKFFWQILKYFLDFKTKKNFSYTWDLFRIRNKNVNKFFVKISVGRDALWGVT